MRDLLLCGLIARDEIKKRTEVGNIITVLKNKRLEANRKRRRKINVSEVK
jgi:hypothetical protein